jgi:hypothetical protein
MTNPFDLFWQIKAAEVNTTLRQAERALRKTESTRRKHLESHIKKLHQYGEKLKKETQSATQTAQEAETRANLSDAQSQMSDAQATAAGQQAATAQSTAEELMGQIPPNIPSPPAAQPPYGNMALGLQPDGQPQEQQSGKPNAKPKTLNLNVAGTQK